MISPDFYNQDNSVALFLGGKIQHFLRKPRTVVIQSFQLPLEYGDNMYTMATKIFGPDLERYWPVIADINDLRQPDDWNPGEVVNLPEIIVTDVVNNQKLSYNDAESSTTVIQY